ncbi:hypothetical protein A2Y99_03360 [Candidatus Gottesmanbacteria bacterium RBG_13_37_7]|uniref:Bacterial toxin RNase RnlA/LsoA DBD domain-containing protein n=1 Tax=Candidatus Gottesmanbacteria bacterium RBG_13_37_7 TaxID=1798369 RepID=A0A1F5YJ97_9BACT|nr:MAG: hypothetical protein A2Y99_03360 [Candidatus Gottesmanbacteria bacterium RBG_13_37_7]
MIQINKQSFFWNYLSENQKDLIEESFELLNQAKERTGYDISDYSYLVFPVAKAYEGFLKQLFLDLGFINLTQYESDHFRIGKALNPNLEKKYRDQSVYDKIRYKCHAEDLAIELWICWKIGRNQLFHYFPHNLKAISLNEAETIITRIISVMEIAVSQCGINKKDY